MRMWLVAPSLLCRQHLLGQHVELHMLCGTIRRGSRLDGYVRNGLIDTSKIAAYHDAVAREMGVRGYRHASPLSFVHDDPVGVVEVDVSLRELARRCDDCAARQGLRV